MLIVQTVDDIEPDVPSNIESFFDTSHVPIDPCGPLEHAPFGDSLRHASSALLSWTLDCGENADVYREDRQV